LALDIDSTETFDSKELIDAIWSAVTKLYGEYGASQTSLTLIDYDLTKKTAVIRVANVAVRMIQAALSSIANVGNKPVAMHVLTISGTIKALHKKA
jgi:RNase P/RNase MRP subunit POP5